MFSYLTLTQRIRMDHPTRQIRTLVDRAPERMDAELEKLTIVAHNLVRIRCHPRDWQGRQT
jgi:hypothetical protein